MRDITGCDVVHQMKPEDRDETLKKGCPCYNKGEKGCSHRSVETGCDVPEIQKIRDDHEAARLKKIKDFQEKNRE